MSHASLLNPADLLPPSARYLPQLRRGDGWDALADLEVFVFAVEAELEAMDLALRRRLVGLIWMLTFDGMQWRVAGWLSGFPSPRCTAASPVGPGWRLAHDDEVRPSAVVVDSRSLRSAPRAWARGFDSGKLLEKLASPVRRWVAVALA